jgi:hypothetical protein
MTIRYAGPAAMLCTAVAVAAASTACSDPGGVSDVVVDSVVISSESVTPVEGRTYEYDFAEVRPDSVLLALWRAGFAVEVAWRPLHYVCEDARGARLTVQLAASDSGIAAHGFSPGTGRLRCSVDLMRYVVSTHPG